MQPLHEKAHQWTKMAKVCLLFTIIIWVTWPSWSSQLIGSPEFCDDWQLGLYYGKIIMYDNDMHVHVDWMVPRGNSVLIGRKVAIGSVPHRPMLLVPRGSRWIGLLWSYLLHIGLHRSLRLWLKLETVVEVHDGWGVNGKPGWVLFWKTVNSLRSCPFFQESFKRV